LILVWAHISENGLQMHNEAGEGTARGGYAAHMRSTDNSKERGKQRARQAKSKASEQRASAKQAKSMILDC
jgi:hypothetical protein